MRPYLRGVKTPLGPPLAQNQPWIAPLVPAETICKKFQSSLRVPEVVPAIWVALRVQDHSLTVAARCRCTAFPSRAREQAV
jgi:hypothetical protein